MIVGAIYHQIGNPTNTVSYCSMFSTLPATAGRLFLSAISTLLRLFLSRQSRSAGVYGVSGAISYRSALIVCARRVATPLVIPVALK